MPQVGGNPLANHGNSPKVEADKWEEENKADITFLICTGLSIALFPVALLLIAVYISKYGFKLNTEQNVGLIVRASAALALYYQAEVYRRYMLVRLQESGATRVSTVCCGLILAGLTGMVVFNEQKWLMLVGLMMSVIFIRNLIAWGKLFHDDRQSHVTERYKRWMLASFGYTFVIFVISPISYGVKLRTTAILIPFLEWELPAYFVDLAPGLILVLGMLVSILRAFDELEKMKRQDRKKEAKANQPKRQADESEENEQ